ncbi:MAG TPA: hypothetical protein VJG67_01210 [Candidatus Paceibacterota bacterium]
MPPCGFNQRAVRGALEFIKGCYEDLRQEVAEGKHPDIETAIEAELGNLETALSKLHLDENGNLVER